MAPVKSAKKKEQVFKIDCSTPVEDNVMKVVALEDYLRGKIKVDKKTGNLGDNVKLASSKTHITVTSGEARARRGNPRLLPHPPLGS